MASQNHMHKHLLTWLIILLCLGSATPVLALPPEAIEALEKIPSDPPPEALTQNRSYYASDEHELYLFKEVIKERGGIYMGLGTDPNYVFAAWANAELILIVDFDQNIVDLHKIYGAFFKTADSPETFLNLWKKENQEFAYAAIDAHNTKRAKWLKRVYDAGRKRVYERLVWMKDTYPKHNVTTFLDDPAQYAYIQKMWREGKVRAYRGDLTKDKTLTAIGKFAKKNQLEVRTLYLTNAEYYFPFATGNYVKNITGLPMPEDSVVLHTFPRGNKEYRQLYHSGPAYQKVLKGGKYTDLRDLMMRRAKRVREDSELFYFR